MSASVQVRRTLTTTALARQHEKALAGKLTRKIPVIPWDEFDRAKYPEAALALAAEAQSKLALGEYGAVELFAHLASSMSLLGVPFDLVAAAARTPSDEIRHADYAIRAAKLLAGKDVTIAVDTEQPKKRWAAPVTQERLDFVMLELCAIGETLSCALLSACMHRAKDPMMHALFAGIVADEVHHARLGWYYFAWRAPQWTRAEQQRVADRCGEILVRTEKQFWHGRDAEPRARKAARALGILESEGQRAAVKAVMEDEIVPGLDALGLGASHAWRVRARGA
jgi:1,2-phenylacetyl-CoA epoxidase catalytic subunit